MNPGALLVAFLKTVKNKNGQQYNPVTVQNYSFCIRRYVSEKVTGVDPECSFPVFKTALSAKKEELKSEGKGNHPNQAPCLTFDQEKNEGDRRSWRFNPALLEIQPEKPGSTPSGICVRNC